MSKDRFCIDIGGTKTVFALIDENLSIKRSEILPTPKNRERLSQFLLENSKRYSGESETAAISVAGRVDRNGKMVFCPNLAALGLNIKRIVGSLFNESIIENDGNCFGLYSAKAGQLKGMKNGIAIVWGTGIGGAVLSDGKIMHGEGLSTELGHIALFDRQSGDIESLIGGGSIKERYGMDGFTLHSLAEKGDPSAIKSFSEIGRQFGRYISSLSYIFDPERIVIGGSFANSWKFMKEEVYKSVKRETIRGKLDIKIEKGKYNVIKGCYFLR